jgi:O-methyltransferase
MMTLAERGINKPRLDLRAERQEHPDILNEEFWEVVGKVHPYTELPTAILFNLYSAIKYIINSKIQGDFVECGVHMGGSIMLMEYALLQSGVNTNRKIFALDTFTGFTRRNDDFDVDIRSGAAVCHPEANPFDYGAAATENMESVGFKNLHVIKGDVFETVPRLQVENIALLRLDTDTYDTTRCELEGLYDRVVLGGVVIVDDYGYTFGCKKAVDDFIETRNIFLQRINANVRAWVKAVR